MKNFIKSSLVLLLIMLSATGCQQLNMVTPVSKNKVVTNTTVKQTLNATIIDIANQLKQSTRLANRDKGTIAITTFVDLNLLEKTTHFGRVLGESMFNELFIRGFNVADFRGKSAISINPTGEFYITRIANKLKNEVPNTYILVGTYTKIDNNILVNVRIMDNVSGKLVASARSIYSNDYCKLGNEICVKAPTRIKRKIRIINDEPLKLSPIQETK